MLAILWTSINNNQEGCKVAGKSLPINGLRLLLNNQHLSRRCRERQLHDLDLYLKECESEIYVCVWLRGVSSRSWQLLVDLKLLLFPELSYSSCIQLSFSHAGACHGRHDSFDIICASDVSAALRYHSIQMAAKVFCYSKATFASQLAQD